MLRTSSQPPATQPGLLCRNDGTPKSSTLHIKAPFDLRGNIMRGLDAEENQAFFDATFPGNTGYATDDLFLFVYLTPPPTPRPKSFAGVPVVFMDPGPEPFATPPTSVASHGFFVSPRQSRLAAHLNYRNEFVADWTPLFDAVRTHFEQVNVPISEVMYWGCFLSIILEDENTDRKLLPSRAANLACIYMFEKDMKRPEHLQALHRSKDPKRGQPDNTSYNILRPGVRVSSDYKPGTQAYYSTTLGTRVRNISDEQFITVAAHGFPEPCGTTVYSGLTDRGRIAGEVAGRIGNTDVGLMRLAPGQRFSPETFGNEETNEPQILRGLREPTQYDVVYLNSPDTGYMAGQVMNSSRRKLDVEGLDDRQKWVLANWIHPDDEADQFPDSMCGAVAYGEDHKVVSFFQYVFVEGPFKGWCVGTSAAELMQRGFM